MSTPTEQWKNWEGKIADERLPLRQYLGGSDHSAVFLTERNGSHSQRSAIKLIAAQGLDEAAQLSRWAATAKLSHPHLIRLFECGRCLIDGTRLLYVVMEYAEENLAEILPLRPLSPAEAAEMLPPVANALAYLHESGYAHACIKPSNIMAVENQLKISADGIGKIGERGAARAHSLYDAPEIVRVGPSPAGDIWSLGGTLVAVMTQNESTLNYSAAGRTIVPETIPQPFHEIARKCLQVDPQQRCKLDDIVRQLRKPSPADAKLAEAHAPESRPKRWMAVPIIVTVLLLIALVGSRFVGHPSPTRAVESPTVTAPPSSDVPATQSSAPAPFSEKEKPARSPNARGGVLQQVMPNVSRSAQNTITGRVKVGVEVAVDASGNVSQAKLVSAGPSKYFASRALEAARGWKFNPPQVDGQATASKWLLRFQIGRTSIQAFPSEMNP